MALIQCSECGRDVSSRALTCPACGNPIAAQSAVLAVARTAKRFAKRFAEELLKQRKGIPLTQSLKFIAYGILWFLAWHLFSLLVDSYLFVLVRTAFPASGDWEGVAVWLLFSWAAYRVLRLVLRHVNEMAKSEMDWGVRLAIGWLALTVLLGISTIWQKLTEITT